MNKKFRFAKIALIFVLCLSLALLSACKPEVQEFTVSFNSDGGSVIASQTVEKGDSINLPVPEKQGFIFEGWYDDEFKVTSPFVVNKDTSLKAKWVQIPIELIPYSIKINDFISFKEMINQNYDKPTVVYCRKQNCSYCDKVMPEISKVKDKYKDQVNFYCIDVFDNDEGSEIWSKYKPAGIDALKTGVPCTIYFYARRDVNEPLSKKTAVWAYGGKEEKNTYGDILERVEELISVSIDNKL